MYGNSVDQEVADYKAADVNCCCDESDECSSRNDPEWVCSPKDHEKHVAMTIAAVTTPVIASRARGSDAAT